MTRWSGRLGAAPLVVFGLACIAVELALVGADLQLWGSPDWRANAYRLGGFRPDLLRGEPTDFAGQPWSMFLTHALLHGGTWHLAGNLLALTALAPSVLRRLGTGGTLLVLLTATLTGGLAFTLLSPGNAVMVGASGGLFGLFGALVVRLQRRLWRVAADLTILNIGIWLLTGGALAWQAHLGGFVAGLVLGAGLPRIRSSGTP